MLEGIRREAGTHWEFMKIIMMKYKLKDINLHHTT